MNGSKITLLLCLLSAAILSACGGGSKASAPDVDDPAPPPIGTDASLGALSTSAASFDQIFQSALYNYTGSVSYLGRDTTVTATTTDPLASILVNGVAAASGVASPPIDLAEGMNTIDVTVTAEDGVTSQSYTLNLDRLGAANLVAQTYFKASNAAGDDRFGGAVTISGDTLAVAAAREDSATTGVNGDATDNGATSAGAVFVFRRDAADTWIDEAYVKASNTEVSDEFGYSIALSGNTLAVGALREDSSALGVNGDQTDNNAVDAGAVYVFTRDATGIWTQQAYIKASNTGSTDGFGASVAISGDTLVVGAHLEDSSATGVDGDQTDNGSQDSGAVYVFVRDAADNWTQQAYLKSSNNDAGDQFGGAVALSGDTLVVGAAGEDSKSTGVDGSQSNNSWSNAGAVYVFSRDGANVWSQQAYIKASNTGSGDRFGKTVALSGDTLIVSAPLEDSAATGVDSVQSDNKSLNAGAAYIFARDAVGMWSQQTYVKASNTDIQDQFGHSLALDGDFLAVGAREDSMSAGAGGDQTDNSAANSGAVYLFERDGAGAWSQQAYLKASNTDSGDEFGTAIAIDGSSLVVSAQLEDSSATGVGGDQTDNAAPDAGAVYIIR